MNAVPTTAGRPFAASLCIALGLLAALATARAWFRPDPADVPWRDGIAPAAREIARGQVRMWQDAVRRDDVVGRMRGSNPEWDFMGRAFLVMALGELSLRDPSTAAANLAVVDALVQGTLAMEAHEGQAVFLLPYARKRPYLVQPARSLFVDGELAMMLGVESRVARAAGRTDLADAARGLLRGRVALLEHSFAAAGTGFAESYPDECWLFDHAFALAALRLADHELGTRHDPLIRAWLDRIRGRVVDPATGLPDSAFTVGGMRLQGPEGSSLWPTAHFLSAVDPAFARTLHDGAHRALARRLWGFAWSREWPASLRTGDDIDSGVTIPGVDASPAASGLALVAAASFGDRVFLRELQSSLGLAAFPVREDGTLRYAAGNAVGDAVLLYALSVGPMWREVQSGEGAP